VVTRAIAALKELRDIHAEEGRLLSALHQSGINLNLINKISFLPVSEARYDDGFIAARKQEGYLV
jgi:hypothetical protein